MIRPTILLLLMIAILGCAGCDANGSAQGGGSENGGGGRIKIGVPF